MNRTEMTVTRFLDLPSFDYEDDEETTRIELDPRLPASCEVAS
jgi:hypothetical protein